MIWLRALAFNIAFVSATLVLGIVGAPLLLGPRSWTNAYGRFWARLCAWLLRTIVGLDWEVRGSPPKGAALIAAKHQSAWETLVFTLIVDRPAFVMKQSLLWAPPYGPYLAKAGMVAIDRSGGSKAIRSMLASAQRIAAEDRPVVIFPEGTRKAPHAAPEYHPGVAALYRGLDVPTTPVALNSGVFWGRNAFIKRPGMIVVEFLEPIEPGLDRRAFMARLEDSIETATERLVKEAEQHGRVVR